MDSEHVDGLITEASEHYLRLLDEAASLLRTLDTASPTAMTEMLERRQNVIERLQNIDLLLGRLPAGQGAALARFRVFQKQSTEKILELDGLVIALAGEKQGDIKRKLTGLKKSQTAFLAYEKKPLAVQRPWVNDVM